MDKKLKPRPMKKLMRLPVVLTLFALGLAILLFSQDSSQSVVQYIEADNIVITEVEAGPFIEALTLRGQVVPKTTIYLDTGAEGKSSRN